MLGRIIRVNEAASPDKVPLSDLNEWVRSLTDGENGFSFEEENRFYIDHIVRNVKAAVVEGKTFFQFFRQAIDDLNIPKEKQNDARTLLQEIYDKISKAYRVSAKLFIVNGKPISVLAITEALVKEESKKTGYELAQKILKEKERELKRPLTDEEKQALAKRKEGEIRNALVDYLKNLLGGPEEDK